MSTPTAPGWYDDPEQPDQLRYFDGIVWTAHTTPRVSPTAASSTIGHSVDVPHGHGPTNPSHPVPPQNPWGAPPPAQGAMGGAYGWQARTDLLPDGAVLAQWWRRLAARIIDLVVIGVITMILSWSFLQSLVDAFDTYFQEAMRAAEQGATPDTTAFSAALAEATLPITLISLAVSVVYETVFLVWRSATPGKMVLGTVVRRVEHAEGLTVVDALKRQVLTVVANAAGLVPYIGLLGSLLSIIDPAWLLWDPKRQALHDKVADTVVVIRQ
jgi:uncharacterized RDD family membrane protein YckC